MLTRSGSKRSAKVVDIFSKLEVFERDDYICQLCGEMLWPDEAWVHQPRNPRYPTVDHIRPIARGGAHSLDNVQTACYGCNVSKQARWGLAA